jgi:hypothetical protein
MVIRIGIVGLSEGNGHPFSFSAIINGYSEKGFSVSGWPIIHDYLKKQPPSEFGIGEAKVTHAWTQDPELTARLCLACKIPVALDDLDSMLGCVDAVIVARDDWRSHYPIAKQFLDAGLSVFIDKPLSLDAKELAYFEPYLNSGKLMSCSGLRFAKELEPIRDYGSLRCINGTVILNWERYAVHLLDAVFETVSSRPLAVARNIAAHESFTLAMDDGSSFTVNAIGAGVKTFHLDFFGDLNHHHVDLHDNFGSFRRTLVAFYQMCEQSKPVIKPDDTLIIMQTLMAGIAAVPGEGYVPIRNFAI